MKAFRRPTGVNFTSKWIYNWWHVGMRIPVVVINIFFQEKKKKHLTTINGISA